MAAQQLSIKAREESTAVVGQKPDQLGVPRNDDSSSYYDSEEYESEHDENESQNMAPLREVSKLDVIKDEWLRIQQLAKESELGAGLPTPVQQVKITASEIDENLL